MFSESICRSSPSFLASVRLISAGCFHANLGCMLPAAGGRYRLESSVEGQPPVPRDPSANHTEVEVLLRQTAAKPAPKPTVGLEVAYFRFSGTWVEMLLFMYVVLCCSAVPTVGSICSN